MTEHESRNNSEIVHKKLFAEIVIRDLHTEHVFPAGALVNASYVRDELENPLLQELRQAIADVQQRKTTAMSSLYALFLLNEFRNPALYPLLLEIMRLSEDQLYTLLTEDGFHECMGRLLATNFTGNIDDLWAIVDDATVYTYARYAVIDAIRILILHNTIQRDLINPAIRIRFEQYREANENDLVAELMLLIKDTRIDVLYDLVQKAYQKELIDVSVYGDLSDFEKECASPFTVHYRNDTFIYSATEEFSQWYDFRYMPPIDLGGKLLVKIGRNEHCFCNSGKKYKKCCIEHAYIVR